MGPPAAGIATGAPHGFAEAAGWAGPSAWRQMLLFVDGSPGVSVQPRWRGRSVKNGDCKGLTQAPIPTMLQ